MPDNFVEIDQNELNNLKRIYEANGSKTYVAYMTISNYIRWFEQDPNIKSKFKCKNIKSKFEW